MIEVEEGGLGPFEENRLARVERVVDEADGVTDHGLDPRRILVEVPVGDLLG